MIDLRAMTMWQSTMTARGWACNDFLLSEASVGKRTASATGAATDHVIRSRPTPGRQSALTKGACRFFFS